MGAGRIDDLFSAKRVHSVAGDEPVMDRYLEAVKRKSRLSQVQSLPKTRVLLIVGHYEAMCCAWSTFAENAYEAWNEIRKYGYESAN